MKSVSILCVVVAAAMARPEETYNPQFENFNVQEIVDNDEQLASYGQCFLDKGPCTPEGERIKKVIPEALTTSCGKCTPKQRELVRIAIRGFQQKLPEIWKEIAQKNDPKGEHKEAFLAFLNASD